MRHVVQPLPPPLFTLYRCWDTRRCNFINILLRTTQRGLEEGKEAGKGIKKEGLKLCKEQSFDEEKEYACWQGLYGLWHLLAWRLKPTLDTTRRYVTSGHLLPTHQRGTRGPIVACGNVNGQYGSPRHTDEEFCRSCRCKLPDPSKGNAYCFIPTWLPRPLSRHTYILAYR